MRLHRLFKTAIAVLVGSITLAGVLNAATPLPDPVAARDCMHLVGTCPGDCTDWCNIYYNTQVTKCTNGCCTCLF